jgi:hypothetical protein
MTEATRVDRARKAFEVNQAQEDATLVASDGQASTNHSAAQQSCDHLIALADATLARLPRWRRGIG